MAPTTNAPRSGTESRVTRRAAGRGAGRAIEAIVPAADRPAGGAVRRAGRVPPRRDAQSREVAMRGRDASEMTRRGPGRLAPEGGRAAPTVGQEGRRHRVRRGVP